MALRPLLLPALAVFAAACTPIDDEDEKQRLDPDGDGVRWPDDCDDADPGVGLPVTWFLDRDGDGWGDEDRTTAACLAPAGHVARGGDCDDGDGRVSPGAEERCDGLDNDCDGGVDDGLATSTWYADLDGDGYGDPATGFEACGSPAGAVDDGTDCDDADAGVNPGADEVCDGVDDDCDGLVDDQDDSVDRATARTWYADADGDGFGDSGAATLSCMPASGSVGDATDCDDADEAVNPDALEACDGVDDDCDGLVDDADPSVTGTTAWYLDFDGDGHGGAAHEVSACVAPDGYVASDDDCDDGDDAVSPDAAEVCDGVDDDCDGLVDDDDSSVDTATGRTFYADADGDLYGDASSPVVACMAAAGTVSDATDCDDTDAGVHPGAAEVWYDGVDADCAGDDDDDADGDGYPGGGGSDCDDADATVNPGATEVCGNGVDDDCDGSAGTCFLRDATATAADVVIPAPSGTDAFALRTHGRGDLNGDGYADVVVGMRATATSAASAGGVYYQYGGVSTSAGSGTIDGASGADEAENGLIVGDVNEDGYDDLVVAAQYAGTTAGIGEVYLVYGPPSISSIANADEEFIGTRVGGELGVAGNLDGDPGGFADFIISENSERVYLVMGGAHGTTTLQLDAPSSTTNFGFSGGSSGLDLNGDGQDDLAVGGPHQTVSSSQEGEVYVQFGPITASGTMAPDLTIAGTETTERFGVHALSAGDTNADGYDDLLVGAQRTDNILTGTADAGAVYLFLGSLSVGGAITTARANATLYGGAASEWFGYRGIDGDCDLDGDDYADFVASAALQEKTFLFAGPITGTDSASAAATATISDSQAWTGCLGDYNGDDVGDVVVGDQGAGAYVFFGTGW